MPTHLQRFVALTREPRSMQWDGDSGPRPGNGSDIRLSDTTFTQHIRPFAAKLAAEPPSTVPGCTPRASPLAAPLSVPAGAPAASPAAEARTQVPGAVVSPSPSLTSPSPVIPASPSPLVPSPQSPGSPSRGPSSVQLFEGPLPGSSTSGRRLLRD